MWSKQDTLLMSRAIQLAKKGHYTTRPNPCVGSVISLNLDEQNYQILGEGYHIQAGGPHAEIHALTMTNGTDLSQATAYVTLEPCSHFGRTPPCAQALIDAGIGEVVVAVEDPNPQVAGRGCQMLRDAGIKVRVGLLKEQALKVNRGFMKRMSSGIPFVTVKLGASLDGKTALANGRSKWITGPQSRRDVQRLRVQSCALITGVDTVLVDDPSLNVRPDELGELANSLTEELLQQPLRVVLDSQARLNLSAKLFSITSPILLVSCKDYPSAIVEQLPSHVSCLVLPANTQGRVELELLLRHLGQQCNQVLVEAGATLAGSFISAELADELILYQGMKILGDSGRGLLNLPQYQQLDEIPSLKLMDQRKLGCDNRYIFSLK